MSERPDTQEGWGARRRLPLILAPLLLVTLFISLFLGGKVYMAWIAPSTRPQPLAMPAPRLETFQTPPGETRAPRARPPKGIDRAMADVAAKGDAFWNGAQR